MPDSEYFVMIVMWITLSIHDTGVVCVLHCTAARSVQCAHWFRRFWLDKCLFDFLGHLDAWKLAGCPFFPFGGTAPGHYYSSAKMSRALHVKGEPLACSARLIRDYPCHSEAMADQTPKVLRAGSLQGRSAGVGLLRLRLGLQVLLVIERTDALILGGCSLAKV